LLHQPCLASEASACRLLFIWHILGVPQHIEEILMVNKERGFTLVEIAIVLVIIGLLLGGALKGESLIAQARAKNLANDFNGIAVAYYAYQDRYHAIPGDDGGASTRWPATAGIVNGDGNRLLCGGYNNSDTGGIACGAGAASESTHAWQHLRASGLLQVTTEDKQPTNSVGGITGLQAGAFGLNGNVVCSGHLSGAIALAVDTQLDDGKMGSGSIQGKSEGDTANPAITETTASTGNYVEDGNDTYVICRQL
jgi:prepilin-type N-terminal cleavage/methylation domain-containing protein